MTGEKKVKKAFTSDGLDFTISTTTKKKKTVNAGDIFQAPKGENLSPVLEALEKAHALIQKETGAPRATISIGRSDKVHGHFTPWTPWKNEGIGPAM